eukprot:GILK01015837.1.p1 GENE.GILK01015837.1~~GILK01015837.1.p1  ORF type:complete len:241 (+),score=25.52 GILK01015837.1:43-765(+)
MASLHTALRVCVLVLVCVWSVEALPHVRNTFEHSQSSESPIVPVTDVDWFLDLVTEANSKVAQYSSKFILIEADGRATGGDASRSKDLDDWVFVFVMQGQAVTLLLKYSNGNFEEPRLVFRPWLETVLEPLPLRLGLDHAIEMVQKQGYKPPFSCASLRKPLLKYNVETSYFINAKTTASEPVHIRVGVFSEDVQPLDELDLSMTAGSIEGLSPTSFDVFSLYQQSPVLTWRVQPAVSPM